MISATMYPTKTIYEASAKGYFLELASKHLLKINKYPSPPPFSIDVHAHSGHALGPCGHNWLYDRDCCLSH